MVILQEPSLTFVFIDSTEVGSVRDDIEFYKDSIYIFIKYEVTL